MFKKIIICFALFHLTVQVNAQFFRGVGLFVGATTSSDRYRNLNPVDNVTFAHALPAPSHRSGEIPYFSVGLLGEFLKYDHIRWQTELEYCNKGGIENPSVAPGTGIRAGATANTFQMIQWNNFAKIFGNEGYRGTPYLMLGARLDYNFARAISAYAAVAGLSPKINLSADAGIGYEFASFSKWHIFTEFHYNPDVIKFIAPGPVAYWHRMFELRLGIIYRPRKALDDCNAPRYHGSNY
jgi:hypothetical protein